MKKILLGLVLFLFTLSIYALSFILPTNSLSATIFTDNFDRTDETSLGSNWSIFFGALNAGVENNKAYIETGAGGYWCFYKVNNLDIQDQDVSITFTHQNGDTTLLARVVDLNTRIAINYYQSEPLQIYEVYNGNYRLIPNTAPNAVVGENYTIRVKLVGDSIKVWVNGVQYADDILNHVFSGSAGFGANDGYTKVFFDNFNINDENGFITPPPSPTPTESATPSASPSATPTVTPTATASATPIALNVPSLKQYSLPWKNKIYAFTKNTIHEFGCALTSAAMVLQYHGHSITPDKLNDWLKNEPDGYIRNGLINWLAVSRYTKLHDSINSPSLEYKRLAGTNENLTNELNNNRPAILKENGHFVVAKSILNNAFGINDPGYSSRNDLTPYNNSFLAINSYIPSHTDLSYMMFVADPNINIKLYDSNNNLVNSQEFTEDPINNLIKPNQKSGSVVKVLIYPKPQNGKYTLKLSGARGKYNLDSYLYDTNGKVTLNKLEGRLNGYDTDKFNINFENRKSIKDKNKKSDFRFWFKDIFDLFKYFH